MGDPIRNNLSLYGQQAVDLAKSYNSVTTPVTLPGFVRHIEILPECAGLQALDVGCGTGRDAHWLAEQGFQVVAVDGAEGMIAEARKLKNHPRISYQIDTAPELVETRALNQKFDVVLLSAFLFHLAPAARKVFYETLRTVSAPGAYVYITLRYGPVPEGRVMFDVPLAELEEMAGIHDFTYHYLEQTADPLGRAEIRWDHIALVSGL